MTTWSSDPAAGGCRDCGAFLLDIVGRFGPAEVLVRWSDDRRRSNEDVDELIEGVWQAQTRHAAENGKDLYNGRLCRLMECELAGRALRLTLAEVTYKEFVGTNLLNPQLRYLHGPEVLADPLGVSAAVVTADGFVLMGRRSARVFSHAGRLHPIGGIVQPGDHVGAVPDVFREVLRELHEELALPAEQVETPVCLGVVRAKAILQPELIFDVSVRADVETIRRAAAEAPDAAEHVEFVPIRDHPGAMVTYLETHYEALTPVALATLLLHGQRRWGMGWFATARGYLRGVI